MSERWIPEITTSLKQDIVKAPGVIRQTSGAKVFDYKIKSIIFTTDIATTRNMDAQAVTAVHPFMPCPMITEDIIEAANTPVFLGVGGGLMQGMRSVYMSLFVEAQGSMGIVLSGPTPIETIKMVDEAIDIPIINTVTSIHTPINEKLTAGVDMININTEEDTAATVRYFRGKYPELLITATGGPTESSIHEATITEVSTITYTPPSNGELFNKEMKKYRGQKKATDEEQKILRQSRLSKRFQLLNIRFYGTMEE